MTEWRPDTAMPPHGFAEAWAPAPAIVSRARPLPYPTRTEAEARGHHQVGASRGGVHPGGKGEPPAPEREAIMHISEDCTLSQAAARAGVPHADRHDFTVYDDSGLYRARGHDVAENTRLSKCVMGCDEAKITFWEKKTNDSRRGLLAVDSARRRAAMYIPVRVQYTYEQPPGKANIPKQARYTTADLGHAAMATRDGVVELSPEGVRKGGEAITEALGRTLADIGPMGTIRVELADKRLQEVVWSPDAKPPGFKTRYGVPATTPTRPRRVAPASSGG